MIYKHLGLTSYDDSRNDTKAKFGHVVQSQPRRSPACTFNHDRGIGKEGSRIEKIVLVHMRKAGGTSMKSYLREVSKKYNITLQEFEAERPVLPEDADNRTLFVTHIREPSARVLSHYKYEMRWKCKFLTDKKSTFVPSAKTSRTTLDAFVERQNIPMTGGGEKGNVWECSHNCYAKWVTGLCWFEGPFNESTSCWSRENNEGMLLPRARNVLFSYNLVVVVEWLQNPDYVNAIETLFGVKGLDKQKVDMYCGAEAAAANKKYPLIVSEEAQQRILQLNQLDTMLYNELTNCSEFDFPNRSIFW